MASQDEVAQYAVEAARSRGYSRDGALAILSTFYQESGLDETIWDPTHTTYGVAQQDGSYPNRFGGYKPQIDAFLDRLDTQKAKPGAWPDIWLDICWLQQAPNWPSAQYWLDNGRTGYLEEIKSRITTVSPYLVKYWPLDGPTPEAPVANSNKPSYNEFPIWSPNNQSRSGTDVSLFLLHTQEGGSKPPADNAAESLGNYCADPTPQVSYHYYISQASDGGVTLVDGVDTDLASWSVGDDNNRSINLCFAGSSVSWTRDDWIKYAGNAIDVAAYVAIQDIAKYPKLPSTFIGTGGNYLPGVEAGVSDHEFVTDIDHWGTHKDVGPNFPSDLFAKRLAYWAVGGESQAPPPVPAPVPVPVQPQPADSELAVLQQVRGRWEMLGWQTQVETLAELRDHILGTSDKGKVGFEW